MEVLLTLTEDGVFAVDALLAPGLSSIFLSKYPTFHIFSRKRRK